MEVKHIYYAVIFHGAFSCMRRGNYGKDMDTIISLAKHRGFVFPGSDIYGGLSNTWDYGPLGVELKNNVKKSLVAKIHYTITV